MRVGLTTDAQSRRPGEPPFSPGAGPGGRALRVCHLAYTFYENDGRVIRYAEALAERGHEVDVIALRRQGQARSGHSNGVRVHRIQRRAVTEKRAWVYLLKILWFCAQSSLLLCRLHLRRRYDVVHVHNIPDFLVFAAFLPRLTGARIILDIHDILPELYAGKFDVTQGSTVFRCLLFVERLSCTFASHVIVANHLWEEKLVSRTVSPGKCTTVMNYPDLRLFKPAVIDDERRDGKFVILYPGTLNRHQGLDIAIKSFALSASRMPDSELHIYGEGPERPALVQLARECGFGSRIKLMERRPLSEIAVVMASANVGVVPKRANGFGNEAFSTKILEFMACGVPVIVSRTQVDAYYFTDDLVRFFESASEEALAEAFIDVYRRRADHLEWVRRAREFAVAHSWQERVADYERLIEKLVATSSARLFRRRRPSTKTASMPPS